MASGTNADSIEPKNGSRDSSESVTQDTMQIDVETRSNANGKVIGKDGNGENGTAVSSRRFPAREARTKALKSLAEPFNFVRIESPSPSRDKPRGKSKSRSKSPAKSAHDEQEGKEEDLKLKPVSITKPGTFTEPELATPSLAYTGLPLESFPNAKIKKDSLWSLNRKKQLQILKRRKPNGNDAVSNGVGSESVSSTGDSESELNSSNIDNVSPSPPPEDKYVPLLRTTQSDSLTSPSDIRAPIRPRRNKSSLQTPKQPKKNTSTNNQISYTRTLSGGDARDEHKIKRIKVISPKKQPSTNLAPNNSNNTSNVTTSRKSGQAEDVPQVDSDDSTKDNDDFCTTCGGPGVFICCDTCPKSFHFTCCEPPLEECPEDNWNCLECLSKQVRSKTNGKAPAPVTIFSQLLKQQSYRNPKEFRLPSNIRNHTFIGVCTGENGEYKDSTLKPELTVRQRQQQSNQIQGYNYNRDLAIDSLYDNNGKPYLCHRCGMSGSDGKVISHCDYCPLTWHIDCLDPPLLAPKTLGSKWKCPNHVDDLMMLGLASKCRQLMSSSVIDVSLQNQFLKIANANNFVIKQVDQPYIKDETDVKLKLYVEDEAEKLKVSIDDADSEIHPNYVVPDYFQNSVATPTGISANANPKLSRILGSNSTGLFVYRVPEESILLDFIWKSKEESKQNTKRSILDTIEDYEVNSRLETNPDEAMVVDSLFSIKNKVPNNELNLDELIKVALADKVKLERDDSENNVKFKDNIDSEEYEELLKVKQLMEIKGRDALMKFLRG
ncbi:transcriptional regulatory protein Rco1p [[Candida] railenensis]|uniref:Transcriptional regulatory protein Rco1p n=1 Tax=[Candida] railenensis TaxID=45579 RepID=A0A9P0QTZ6_9ASCO|nr:transcriptional regulatory protein Rco1p [[Candida] railenensis]